ncbi:hypothetical protein KI387_029650, partial [Taxus chinensis]
MEDCWAPSLLAARVSFAGRAQRTAVAVGVLPSLSMDATGCVLVGDPQQQSATFFNKAAGVCSFVGASLSASNKQAVQD